MLQTFLGVNTRNQLEFCFGSMIRLPIISSQQEEGATLQSIQAVAPNGPTLLSIHVMVPERATLTSNQSMVPEWATLTLI